MHRKFKLIYLSHDLTKKVELSLTRRKVKFIALALLFGFLVINALTGVVSSRLSVSQENRSLEAENRELREHLEAFEGRIAELGEQLSTLSETDNQLRLMADLPLLEQAIEAGMGGAVDNSLSGPVTPEVGNILETLDKIDREIELQKASFTEISEKLALNAEMLAHMPTLRPVDVGYISSDFGPRRDPFTGKMAQHSGLDFSAPRGTPVVATAAGEVVYATRYQNYGKFIVVDHGHGYETAYGHLNAIHVKVGQKVSKGQIIGLVGSTGRSTAPHLHYEVMVDGRTVDPMDFVYEEPATYSNYASNVTKSGGQGGGSGFKHKH